MILFDKSPDAYITKAISRCYEHFSQLLDISVIQHHRNTERCYASVCQYYAILVSVGNIQ